MRIHIRECGLLRVSVPNLAHGRKFPSKSGSECDQSTVHFHIPSPPASMAYEFTKQNRRRADLLQLLLAML